MYTETMKEVRKDLFKIQMEAETLSESARNLILLTYTVKTEQDARDFVAICDQLLSGFEIIEISD